MTWLYTVLARLFGATVDLFYRRRHLGGAVPDGPVVLVANHPNGLVDPIVVMRIAGRPVRFLAKEPLFRMPVIGRLLRWVGALPVYRARDGHDTAANRSMFDAVYDALGAGGCICLFPEGTSHSEPQIQPLKTGAARMALGAAARQGFESGLQVVPVGLTYRDKARFRSEAAAQIGDPIEADRFGARYVEDERDAVRRLTARIDAGIREVTVNLDRWDDLPLLELVGHVWADDEADPIRVLRAAADAQRSFVERDPERLTDLRRRLEGLRATLEGLGLPPEALDREYRPASVGRFVARNLVALLGAPLALVGAAAYALPYYAVRLTARRLADEQDVVATVKVLASMVYYPVWHFALVSVLAWQLGSLPALLLGLGLPVAGLYSQHFRERRADAWREVKLFFRLLDKQAVRQSLRAERAALRAEIEAVRELVG